MAVDRKELLFRVCEHAVVYPQFDVDRFMAWFDSKSPQQQGKLAKLDVPDMNRKRRAQERLNRYASLPD